MKLSTILLLPLLGATTTLAHHLLAEILIDGAAQGLGTCLRVPPNTNPLTDVTSQDMACNVAGSNKQSITCAANAGSTITLQWRTWPDGSQDVPIDVSHQGPCAVYMKRMGNSGNGSVSGGGWFKIWHDGFRDGEFCTERLRRNGNRMEVTVPRDLEVGYYTLRAEQLALHQGQFVGGAQWYIGCAQLFVYSTGGEARPSKTVSIPGYVDSKHPGVLFNYWANMKPKNYQTPGPEVYLRTNAGGSKPKIVAFERWGKYSECLTSNGNWCGVSLPKYTNEDGCWKSADSCWKQLKHCYAEAGPTGNAGCRKWETGCEKLNGVCNSCNWKSCPGGKQKRSWKGRLDGGKQVV